MDFVNKYPLSLKEIITTPMIFREAVPQLEGFPFPTLSAIRDLAEFAGHSYGTLRTAISRTRASGELKSFQDKNGVTRFKLTKLQKSVSNVVINWQNRPQGFTIVVFSFRKNDEKERRIVREILKYFGFKKLAQNTYINGMIDTTGMETEIEQRKLDQNLYIFRCPEVDSPGLLERLRKIFDVEKRARELSEFETDLKAFLNESSLREDEFARRVFYAGPLHYSKCFVEEPPLPASVLPEGYPLGTLQDYLNSIIRKRSREITSYYLKFSNQGGN